MTLDFYFHDIHSYTQVSMLDNRQHFHMKNSLSMEKVSNNNFTTKLLGKNKVKLEHDLGLLLTWYAFIYLGEYVSLPKVIFLQAAEFSG